MSLHAEAQAGADEYGRRLVARQESERLAALRHEARFHGNASAFAAAVDPLFSNPDDDDTDDTDDTEEN